MCQKKASVPSIVLANTKVGHRFYRLDLELQTLGAKVFAHTKPGQFAEFDTRSLALPPVKDIPADLRDKSLHHSILRRPFSFCGITVEPHRTILHILYLVLGPSTVRLSNLKAGNELGIIGPLGNGFWVPENKTTALILAGGMGAPPLRHLATYLLANKPLMRIVAFSGARTKADLPFSEDLVPKNVESHIATDDGSVGFKGFVTDCLADWLIKHAITPEQTIIYTCGPDPMLAAAARLAAQKNINCQVSTERLMGCGIGICQSCAVECVNADGQKVYKLCCTDGPVFDAREVVWK